MQVADAYSVAYPEADKNKIVPIATTIAVHVLILSGLAMSFGVVPALKQDPGNIDTFFLEPEKPEPLPTMAPLEKVELNPIEYLPLEPNLPPIEREIEIPPGEKSTDIKKIGDRDVVTLPPSPGVVGARLLQSSEPLYPSVSRIKGEVGTVIVRITITPYGTVGGAEVEKSSGYSRLDEAALKATRSWRFAPAKRGSEAIASSMLVPVRFEMK